MRGCQGTQGRVTGYGYVCFPPFPSGWGEQQWGMEPDMWEKAEF